MNRFLRALGFGPEPDDYTLCAPPPPPDALPDLTVLRLEPGDILLLHHPMRLSEAAKDRIKAGWQRVLEKHGLDVAISVVCLEEGMRAAVLRPGAPATVGGQRA